MLYRCIQWLYCLYTAAFCLLWSFGSAQDPGFFQQVWQEQGLSQSSVYHISQDSQGFIWLATQDGLNRYDGKHMDLFNMQPFNSCSISGDIIESVGKTSDNRLWVHTAEGLDIFDMDSLQAKRIKPLLKDTGNKTSIYRIWVLDTRLFLLTARGFNELVKNKGGRYEWRSFRFEDPARSNERFTVFSVCEDDAKHLLVGTTEGIYQCIPGTSVFRAFSPPVRNPGDKSEFLKPCTELLFRRNMLYFSSGNKLYGYNRDRHTLHTFTTGVLPEAAITCLLMDNRGKLWIGTDGNGLYRVSEDADGSFRADKHFMDNGRDKYGLKCNYIECLFQGADPREDGIWIGSREAGAFLYSYSKNSVRMISSVLDKPKLSFFGLVKDRQNTVWCGTRNGIYRIDLATHRYHYIDLSGLIKNAWRYVQAIYCDNNDEIWVGLDNALYTIDKTSNALVKVAGGLVPDATANAVNRITGTGDELMAATALGLVIYDKISGKTKCINRLRVGEEAVSLGNAGAIYIDSRKNCWLRTENGVVMIDRAWGKNRRYAHDPSNQNSLLTNSVFDIKETARGDILIATSKGLSMIEQPYGQSTIKNYHKPSGLSNNFIYGLVPDGEGKFWLSTNYGISVFDPDKKTFKSYHATDGIYINEFNSACHYAAADGELLFGGVNGLIGFYPEKLLRNFPPPSLVLRAFKVNEQRADSLVQAGSHSLDLAHHQNSLYLEFAVPDFSGIGRNKLFYHLSGTSNGWKEIGESNAFWLANIAPGNYVLQVKAVNDEGMESPEPFSLSFQIRPPWWKSTWFLVLVLIAFLFLITAVYRFRLRNKIARIKEMNRVRQEENEKVRKAAALDLHDEFGNGLTRISVLVETLKIKIAKENKDAQRILNLIAENSIRLYQGTKDFIWSIHPGNDNLYELVIRIKDFGDELFYDAGIRFEVHGLKDEFRNFIQLPGVGRNITMIYKEAMTNVLKHAGADKAHLHISEKEGEIKIILRDNGKGFDLSRNKNGFGLSNMQHRAAKAGTHLAIHSQAGKGSETTLTINYNKAK